MLHCWQILLIKMIELLLDLIHQLRIEPKILVSRFPFCRRVQVSKVEAHWKLLWGSSWNEIPQELTPSIWVFKVEAGNKNKSEDKKKKKKNPSSHYEQKIGYKTKFKTRTDLPLVDFKRKALILALWLVHLNFFLFQRRNSFFSF